MRIGRPALIVLILLTSIYLSGVWADPPSCSPFNDVTGCFFGENWENGTPPCSTWACSGFLQNGNLVSVSPGLNGTNRAVRLLYGNDTSGSLGTGGWADINLGHVSPNGDVFWVEWWTRFSPGFTFRPGATNYPSFKHAEFSSDATNNGCQQRMLMTLTGDASSNYTTASPEWYIGANQGQQPSCTTANPTAPGTQDQGQTAFPRNAGLSFTFQPGVVYHVVTEFKSHGNQQGYIKTWFNGQLALNATNITTCPFPTSCTWSFIRFGGQYGVSLPGSYGEWDQFRATTTNLSPGASKEPTAPTGVGAQ